MGRALTERERDVLRFMVDNAQPFADDPPVSAVARGLWRDAIPVTQATDYCGCGLCPSIELADEAGRTPIGEHDVVLNASHPKGYLLLFIDHNRLSYLDFAPWDDERFEQFPAVVELKI
jgi:hypothetical protein